ncbi:MAG: 7-cyano-7-deazaguanine synthase QueC [Burkholderiales bacterium]|nr:7-cyano-7-deazaguanine synthase QueC [Burkholderiales bacterium]
MKKKAVVILSGGLDSSTLAYYLANEGYDLICVSFNYGQRHIKELASAKYIADSLNSPHHVIDLSFMREFLQNSSLVNQDLNNPKEEYARENMLITVVPNRNTMMLSLAWTIACANEASLVAFGPHKGDNYVYADCREEYFEAMNDSLRLGTIDSRLEELTLSAPFIQMTKIDIVNIGNKLKVPFEKTWSCYDGQDLHCGTCGTCRQRKEAFTAANVNDLTVYKE